MITAESLSKGQSDFESDLDKSGSSEDPRSVSLHMESFPNNFHGLILAEVKNISHPVILFVLEIRWWRCISCAAP